MKDLINRERIPKHIAVIMDGNGRWAQQQGAKRIFGHRNAIKSVREVSEGCAELGVEFLTLYAFSTENWNRPRQEVNALMQLLIKTIRKEVPTLQKNNIRLATIGKIDSLPDGCQDSLREAIQETAQNDGMTLTLALSYSGRWEIINAVKALAHDIKDGKLEVENIDDKIFSNYLNTKSVPDPELMIRTSGEQRISNFLLWQLAYSELFFTDVLWPDFRKKHLHEALLAFQNRERRFGKTSAQVVEPISV